MRVIPTETATAPTSKGPRLRAVLPCHSVFGHSVIYGLLFAEPFVKRGEFLRCETRLPPGSHDPLGDLGF